MSKKNSFDMSNFEFEIDDLEYYLIRNRDNSNNNKKKNNKKKREDEVLLQDLPPEIIHGILVKFPPEHLYQELRLVCKAWKNMISENSFVFDSFSRIKPDFIVQRWSSRRYKAYRMEIDEKQLDYKLHDLELCQNGLFRSSFCGMLLTSSRLSNLGIPQQYRIIELKLVNFLTSFCLTLPRCPSGCPHSKCGMALGFDPSTKFFKVVHSDGFGFEIFTIGDSSNAWKQIPGPWNNSFEIPSGLLDNGWSDPVSITGRFLYWNVYSPEFVLSMDVSEETTIKIKLPCDSGEESAMLQPYHLGELEGHLSLTHGMPNAAMDIWILQEIHGKWFKKYSIVADMIDYHTMTSHKECTMTSYRERILPDLKLLFPVAATTNGVLVLMHTRQRCIYLYDTRKGEMKKFETRSAVDNFILHGRSLLRL